MATTTKRPVHLNLMVIRMPVPAVMSIAHRASGALLVLTIPFFIYVLDLSLAGEAGFAAARQLLDNILVKILVVLLGWGLMHHLFAGLRYLALDLDLGVDKQTGRLTAWIVMLGAPLATLVLAMGAWS